jgi:hypothetical protein
MAQEPGDIVLRMLRGIRAAQDSHGNMLMEHSEQFKALRKENHDWQETIATAAGLAVHAKMRHRSVDEEIADLKKRVETLEKAK